jgi:hypothetical protein
MVAVRQAHRMIQLAPGEQQEAGAVDGDAAPLHCTVAMGRDVEVDEEILRVR